MGPRPPLDGRRILVVEDDAIIARFILETLEGAGATVVGVAGDCLEARRLLDGTGIEAAVIDLHLHGSTGHSLAHLLSMRKVPYLLETGHAMEALRDHPNAMVVQKPFSAPDLIDAVKDLLSGRASSRKVTYADVGRNFSVRTGRTQN